MENYTGNRRVVYRRSLDGVSSYSRVVTPARNVSRVAALAPVANEPAENTPRLAEPVAAQTPRRPIDMSLPGGESIVHRQFRRIDSVWRQLRKWLFRATVTAIFLLFATAGILFSQGYLKLHQVLKGGHTAAALQKNVNPNLLDGEGDGRVNILLLGIGGPGHDGPDLTDTILLLSIDPVNHKAALVSVPRDIWVQVPGYGDMKINAAYANIKYRALSQNPTSQNAAMQAGINSIEKQVNKVLGVSINYYTLVDFTAFKDAINTVGGVDINVAQTLYDPTMAWQNNWSPIIAKKGMQHMDGYHALLYARSRETTSDFARGQRQRQVITALEQKVFSLGTFSNPVKDAELINAFGNHVSTDLSINNVERLYQIMSAIPANNIKSIGLTDEGHDLLTTGMIGDQSVDYPKAGLFDYNAIREYIRGALPDGYLVKEQAKIEIVSSGAAYDAAQKEATLLKSYGYNVIKVAEDPSASVGRTEIVDLSKGTKPYTKHYLENRFDTVATAKLPPSVSANGADFVIIITK